MAKPLFGSLPFRDIFHDTVVLHHAAVTVVMGNDRIAYPAFGSVAMVDPVLDWRDPIAQQDLLNMLQHTAAIAGVNHAQPEIGILAVVFGE